MSESEKIMAGNAEDVLWHLHPALERFRTARIAADVETKRSPASDRWSALQREREAAEEGLFALWEKLR